MDVSTDHPRVSGSSRIDLLAMKDKLLKDIGEENASQYWNLFSRFIRMRLSKVEFDDQIPALLGEHIYRHNEFVRAIIANAAGKEPPENVPAPRPRKKSRAVLHVPEKLRADSPPKLPPPAGSGCSPLGSTPLGSGPAGSGLPTPPGTRQPTDSSPDTGPGASARHKKRSQRMPSSREAVVPSSSTERWEADLPAGARKELALGDPPSGRDLASPPSAPARTRDLASAANGDAVSNGGARGGEGGAAAAAAAANRMRQRTSRGQFMKGGGRVGDLGAPGGGPGGKGGAGEGDPGRKRGRSESEEGSPRGPAQAALAADLDSPREPDPAELSPPPPPPPVVPPRGRGRPSLASKLQAQQQLLQQQKGPLPAAQPLVKVRAAGPVRAPLGVEVCPPAPPRLPQVQPPAMLVAPWARTPDELGQAAPRLVNTGKLGPQGALYSAQGLSLHRPRGPPPAPGLLMDETRIHHRMQMIAAEHRLRQVSDDCAPLLAGAMRRHVQQILHECVRVTLDTRAAAAAAASPAPAATSGEGASSAGPGPAQEAVGGGEAAANGGPPGPPPQRRAINCSDLLAADESAEGWPRGLLGEGREEKLQRIAFIAASE